MWILQGPISRISDYYYSRFAIGLPCYPFQSSIWGLTKQGKTCKLCGLSVHSRCELKVISNASSRLQLPLRTNYHIRFQRNAREDTVEVMCAALLHYHPFHHSSLPIVSISSRRNDTDWKYFDNWQLMCRHSPLFLVHTPRTVMTRGILTQLYYFLSRLRLHSSYLSLVCSMFNGVSHQEYLYDLQRERPYSY